MGTIKEILTRKGSRVWTIDKDAKVLQAAQMMKENNIGGLVVLAGGHVAGMFTERDVLRRIVTEQRDPASTRVFEVMTEEVVCCTSATTIEEARGAMMHRRLRHLPVVEGNGELVGLISIGDLNAYQVTSQEQTIYQLHEYLYGRT